MNRSEEVLQASMYKWFHNTYPQFRGLLCYNLNNSANAIVGGKNKQLGLQKGRSDLVFYFKSKAYMIEVKTEKGNQQPNQLEWEKLIVKQGFEYYIIRTLEEFKNLIERIIKNG